ncbi:MmcQ/YjbR family DNA-binding protein [Caulobacter sp. CCNWLY153]|uniref:MmcQ/YjbR family DNA-binding protein n=1 Tax=Caulobacter radicis TaxID=2172650 RepID=A0A2T9JAZ8_9CAUL|nr:MmcQ/YjbR family DNA-binding protein [Caulobacter radicis]PVM79401.1 hypothetical protein DDF65_14975 [Caulobacter radicis]PVM83540.1 hypothetical protein DDF62_24865 [Caulobacter radicis]
MTPDDFRQLALSQLNARVASRLGTIEFLVGDKVFATLGAPDPAFAVLRLSPEDQAAALAAAPGVFSPQAGGAGARGVTCVRLALAEAGHLKPVLAKAAGKARNSRSAFSRIG